MNLDPSAFTIRIEKKQPKDDAKFARGSVYYPTITVQAYFFDVRVLAPPIFFFCSLFLLPFSWPAP
jgi:hypothetical protein